MYSRHFIKLIDSTGAIQRLDFTSLDAAGAYWREHHADALAAGGRLMLCSDYTVQVAPVSSSRVCMPCAGTGTVVTRRSADGLFPDEDTCPACHGLGELPVMDATGDYDSASVDYCTCDAGRELEASELEVHIAAVNAAEFDARYAHDLALVAAPEPWGMTVPLDDRPF